MTDQFRKAFLGLLRINLFLALFIFVPAWSLNYWEGWLYLAVVSISISLVTAYFLKYDPALIERRMKWGAHAEPEKGQQIIMSTTAALSSGTFIVSAFEHCIHGSAVSPPSVLAANALVLVGIYIVFRTFRENSFAAGTVRVEPNQPVISTGPYAWVRHPMYAGCLLGFLATPLALGSLWGLIPAVLSRAAIVVRLMHEERFLVQNLPGYETYRRQVRYRLIPLVW